jgi:hypothetical protein
MASERTSVAEALESANAAGGVRLRGSTGNIDHIGLQYYMKSQLLREYYTCKPDTLDTHTADQYAHIG